MRRLKIYLLKYELNEAQQFKHFKFLITVKNRRKENLILCEKMNLEAGLRQFGSFSDYVKRNQYVLTTTLPNFSNQGEPEFTEYETSDDDFGTFFKPAFYANGDCKENEGYVSIQFYGCYDITYLTYLSQMEFNCTVSVIDIAGNKRFKQTLVYIFDRNSHRGSENDAPKFGLDRYLKRDTLCNEPSELLPGDCLTIYIEADYLIRFYMIELTHSVAPEAFVSDGENLFFSLDSPFGRILCKVCDYFQRASDIPMIENKTRCVYIPPEELKTFVYMNRIFMGAKGIRINSIADVCQLYTVADKYDIQTVIETCRQLVKSFLCKINDSKIFQHAVESIPLILELAETYNDESLKEMVAVYMENKKHFETNECAFEELLRDKLSSDWNCEYEEIFGSSYFKLVKIGGKDKEPEMEFYR